MALVGTTGHREKGDERRERGSSAEEAKSDTGAAQVCSSSAHEPQNLGGRGGCAWRFSNFTSSGSRAEGDRQVEDEGGKSAMGVEGWDEAGGVSPWRPPENSRMISVPEMGWHCPQQLKLPPPGVGPLLGMRGDDEGGEWSFPVPSSPPSLLLPKNPRPTAMEAPVVDSAAGAPGGNNRVLAWWSGGGRHQRPSPPHPPSESVSLCV